MHSRPSYLKVFLTFARNSLVRDMTFRANFIIESISATSWMFMNLGFYTLIFTLKEGGVELGSGDIVWRQYEFFTFFATTVMINSLVQAFFMPNCEEFSELIRTGNLDFALLKPIDTQFLVSLHRVNWSSLGNFVFGLGLLIFSVSKLYGENSAFSFSPLQAVLYVIYLLCGVVILYSLMIALSSTSVWLGRNQTLYNFWFYITNFSRYPMEIYGGSAAGVVLRQTFTFGIPILIAVNVPARFMAFPLQEAVWWMALYALAATALSFVASRWVFRKALLGYRSASS